MARLGSLSRVIRDYLYDNKGRVFTVDQMHTDINAIRPHGTSPGAIRKALNNLVDQGYAELNSVARPATYRWKYGQPRPADYKSPAAIKTQNQKGNTAPMATDQRAELRGMLRKRLEDIQGVRKEDEEAEKIPEPKRPKKTAVSRPNGQKYWPRDLAGEPDVDRLRQLRDKGIPAILAGPPGTGKTAWVEAAFNGQLHVVTGDEETSVTDFLGDWYPTGKADEYVWADGPLVVAMKKGEVLFVDDATLINPKALAVMYPAMDGRGEIIIKSHMVRGKDGTAAPEVVKAKPGFYVVAAHNPGVHGAILTDALSSRFIAQIWVESDMVLAASLGVPERMLKFVRLMKTERDRNDAGLWIPQLREMLAFRDIAKVLGEKAAAANLIGVAPEGADRDIVISKLNTVFGEEVKRLELGGQL